MKQKSLKRLLFALLCLVVAHTGRAADGGAVAQIGTQQFATLTEAIAKAAADGTTTTIKLIGDVTGDNTVACQPDFTIPASATVVLDLNGHTITGSGWGSVFFSNGTFTITDNSTEKSGVITGGYAKGWNTETNTFYTKDDIGKRTDIMTLDNSQATGGAVNVQAGKFILKGGTLKKNYAYQGGAVYVVDAENFAKYKALELVDIENPVEATLNNCTITDNHTYWQGGGVGAYPYAHLTINPGAVISNNSTCDHGGGVVVARTSVVTMNGGTVSGNTAHQGAGVYATGFFTMTGGTIEGNSAQYCETRPSSTVVEICGAGLLVKGIYASFGKTTLKGGSIINNEIVPMDKATMYNGAGVYAANGAAVSIYDGINVTGNTIKDGAATSNNFQLMDGGYLLLESDLTKDVSVTMAYDNGLVADLNGHAHNGHIKVSSNLQVVETDGKIYAMSGTTEEDAVCMVKVNDTNVLYFPSLEAGLNMLSNVPDHTLTLLKDIDGQEVVYIPYGNNVLDLGGHTIKASATANENKAQYAFLIKVQSQVENKSTFTLKNGTIDGNNSIACLRLYGYGKAEISDVKFINGNQPTSTAGSLWIDNYCDVKFSNCVWSGNYAFITSGAVYLAQSTTSVFEKCSFSSNTAGQSYGGAIRCDGQSNMTLTDCTFDGNKANSTGGAIYMAANTNLTINGGSLTNNTSSGGGAIYAYSAVVDIKNATISGNTATFNGETTYWRTVSGGGLYAANGSKVTLTNTAVTNNLVDTETTSDFGCSAIGGGICFGGSTTSSSSLTIKGGSVSNNTVKVVTSKGAAPNGAGIYASTLCVVSIEDAEISGNAPSDECSGTYVNRFGSALYLNNAQAIIKSGKIAGTLYKSSNNGNNCKIAILGGKFNNEANTGTATTGNGQFKFSDFLTLGAKSAANTDDDKDTYPYVVTLGDIVLQDKAAYDNDLTVDGVNVSYTRELSAKVGTIVLPFVPEANSMIKYYAFGAMSVAVDGTGVIKLEEVKTIEPNKGYIYKYQGDITNGSKATLTLSANGTTIHPNTVEDNICGDWTVKGTYAQVQKNGSTDAFYYVKASDGVMYRAQGKTNFAPYRAWATYGGTSGAKAFRLEIDGELTGIATVEADGQLNVGLGKVYDLSGREVTAPQHGNVYVVGGKKIKY